MNSGSCRSEKAPSCTLKALWSSEQDDMTMSWNNRELTGSRGRSGGETWSSWPLLTRHSTLHRGGRFEGEKGGPQLKSMSLDVVFVLIVWYFSGRL